jgi:hypothetical protein
MFKDVQLGIHLANQQRLEVPLTTVVGGVLYGALCNGWGDLDFASLYRVYSEPPKPDMPMALPEPAAVEPPAQAGEASPTEPRDTTIVSEAQPAPQDAPAGQAPESGAAPEPPASDATSEVKPSEEVKPVETEVVGKEAEPPHPVPAAEGEQSASTEAKSEEAISGEKPAVNEPAATGKVDAESAEEPKGKVDEPGEEKAGDAIPADASTAENAPESEPGVNAGESAKAEEKPISEEKSEAGEKSAAEVGVNGSDEDDAADAGLSGFFSRVFRRRGAPVQK